MTIYSSRGVAVSIGTTAPAEDIAAFVADTYTPIGEIESIESFGDKAEIVTFNSITDGRVRKAVGLRDAGEFTLECGWDPADAGQIAAREAGTVKDLYNFKVELADKPASGAAPKNSVRYFKGLVTSTEIVVGGGNDITKLKMTVAIYSEILGTDASAT